MTVTSGKYAEQQKDRSAEYNGTKRIEYTEELQSSEEKKKKSLNGINTNATQRLGGGCAGAEPRGLQGCGPQMQAFQVAVSNTTGYSCTLDPALRFLGVFSTETHTEIHQKTCAALSEIVKN